MKERSPWSTGLGTGMRARNSNLTCATAVMLGCKSSLLFFAFPTCKIGKTQNVFVVTIKCSIRMQSTEHVVFISTRNIFVLGWQAESSPPLHGGCTVLSLLEEN